MNDTDPKRDVERQLSELLTRVIDWLKFAEAKNTGAVGLVLHRARA